MAKMQMDWNTWVEENNITEEKLQIMYQRVKKRRNIYGVLSLLTPAGFVLAPFWVRSVYLTKALKYRDLDVNLSPLVSILWFLLMLGSGIIYPLIMMSIIKRTDWGMGLKLK